MRKFIVRILNLFYLVAATVAAFSFLTEPLFDIQIGLNITKEQLAELLPEEETSKQSPYKLIYREEAQPDIESLLTPGKVLGAVGDLELKLDLKITARQALDIKNKNVLKDVLESNINALKNDLAEMLEQKLPELIKDITKEFAVTIMSDKIQEQINSYFSGNEEDAPQVNPEDVSAIIDNIFNTIDSGDGEPVEASELTNALMGEKVYAIADPQPTESTFEVGVYYTKDSNDVYTEAAAFADNTTYYVADGYTPGVLNILNDLKESGTPGYETLDIDNISSDDIESSMVDALKSVPGMTNSEFNEANPQPTSETFGNETYYVKNEQNEFVKAEAYESDVGYYTEKVTITSVDGAIDQLLLMLLGENKTEEQTPEEEISKSRAMMVRAEGEEEEIDTKELIIKLIDKFIPFDVSSLDLTFGGYVPYVLAGLVALGILPWAWFALVTIFRTIRKRKCWTKPRIIFIFAFLQLILGVVLTLFLRYGLPMVLPLAKGLPSQYTPLLTGLSLNIVTNCFIPSIVYLVLVVYSLVYAIFAHGVKREYKEYKREKRLYK